MESYSRLSKLIHRIYLKNYWISKTSLDFEKDLFNKKIDKLNLEQIVFVTGLARSGTTSVLRKIYDQGSHSSLKYSNMPFLFLPNIWKNNTNQKLKERAHNDGIFINSRSPEEFDEYFWKTHLNDRFIKKDYLLEHSIEEITIEKYIDYIKLICISENKSKYISKNNNNILRLLSLKKIHNSKFIFLIRDPLSHASSLIKLDKKFLNEHDKNKFSLDYFSFLGHHEFGLSHKQFRFNSSNPESFLNIKRDKLEYWLLIWKNYYQYLFDNFKKEFLIIFFDDYINNQSKEVQRINNYLGLNIKPDLKKFIPPKYANYKSDLLDECTLLYKNFKTEFYK